MVGLPRFAALAAVLSLGGCALFAPPYDPTIDQKTSSAYEGVAKLVAKAELGEFADRASFPPAADQYATVQASLTIAAQRAETAPASAGPAKRARELLANQIKGCRAQVASMADQHKRLGLQPNTGATQPVMVSCDQAARAAQAMKGGD